MPLIAAFTVHFLVYFPTGFTLYWLVGAGFACSLYLWLKYGENDYSKFTPTGPYRVGYKEFTTKQWSNECSVFYPAANDGSGQLGVPFLSYG